MLGAASLLLLLLAVGAAEAGPRAERPHFSQEPPSRLLFSNTSGALLACAAAPATRLAWLLADGSPAVPLPGLREVTENGSLHFPAFPGTQYRAEVHSASYRCLASNLGGSVLSREARVQAVVRSAEGPRALPAHVLVGNTAALTCESGGPGGPGGSGGSGGPPDRAEVVAWYKDGALLLPTPQDGEGRVAVALGGRALLVHEARAEDGRAAYSCVTLDALTGERRRSDAAQLTVSEASGTLPPRLLQRPPPEASVALGATLELLCVAQGIPPPIVTWYREEDGRAAEGAGSRGGGRLVLRNAGLQHAGRWACRAASSLGEQTAATRLAVLEPLTVALLPPVQVVSSGGSARLNCSVLGAGAGAGAAVEWARDGHALAPSARWRILGHALLLADARREDAGVYQCLVRRGADTAQAAAELRLGDAPPELIYTFIEQALRPGPAVSLRCSAAGTPLPRLSWLLDGRPLQDMLPAHKYSAGQRAEASGDVVGHLNISAVRAEDGGLYGCRASSPAGEALHQARLNVYGPPYIRFVGPQRAVAGSEVTLQCPYSGYPVAAPRWERAGAGVAQGAGLRVAAVAEGLRVSSAAPGDAGAYTCTVSGPAGELARRDLQLLVLKPPQLVPFMFPANVEEGSNIQATCSVMSGDQPIYFSWFKDDLPIPPTLDVEQKSMEFFSLLIIKKVSSAHSGSYTCAASNSAAKADYSAQLVVRVAPQWIHEPQDVATLVGTPLSLHCSARGFPAPTITWMKGHGVTAGDYRPLELPEPLENGTLTLLAAGSRDEGSYLCKADNGIGPGLSKVLFISVNEPPRFDTGSRNISAKRGESVSLECEVFGDNPIRVLWTHDMNRLNSANYRLTVSEARTESGLKSQLSVRQADRQDSGLYKCQAENTFGRSELLIHLAVQERPDTPQGLEVVEVSSRSVRLQWRRPYDGHSALLAYLLQHRALPGPPGGLAGLSWDSPATVNASVPAPESSEGAAREQTTLGGLRPATVYVLRLMAVNRIDRSAFTDFVVAKTQEEAPLEAPRNVQVQAAGPGELQVTWQAPGRDSWNGELLGYSVSWRERGGGEGRAARVAGASTAAFSVGGLAKFTRYAVSVAAYNGAALGPPSAPVSATTLEGVPEAPPGDVRCAALSPRSLQVSWRPPPPQLQGGPLQGYKVHFRAVPDAAEPLWAAAAVKRTAATDTQLHALRPHTAYSVRLGAYTGAGDGALSRPRVCTTEQDVPGAPAAVKALPLGADAVLVAWLPPASPNGRLLHYTVYAREAGPAGRASEPAAYTVPDDGAGPRAGGLSLAVRPLREARPYEFWVSAATEAGEGESTPPVTQEPRDKGAARIASFGGAVAVGAGGSVTLACRAQGSPPPRTRWLRGGAPVTHHRALVVTQHGDLVVPEAEPSLADNYTCVARNSGGEDSVTYSVRVLRPPPPPGVRPLPAPAPRQLALRLEPPAGPETPPVHGYVLHYKREDEAWQTVELSPDTTSLTLRDLKCGSPYRVYATSHNLVGSGSPSEVLTISTEGAAPTPPAQEDFLGANSTSVRLALGAWRARCPVLAWSVQWRALGGGAWRRAPAAPDASELVLRALQPATWYQLRVGASTEAGTTAAHFTVATTTTSGARIAAPSSYPELGLYPDSWLPDWVLLLVLSAAVTLTAVFLVGFLLIQRRRPAPRPSATKLDEDEGCKGCEQLYTALPSKAKADGSEELYEISPYATFSVAGGRGGPEARGAEARGAEARGAEARGAEARGAEARGAETRGGGVRSVSAATLDYTLQFRTFGHSDNEAPAGPSRAQRQRYHRSDEGRLPPPPDSDSDSSGGCSHRPRPPRLLRHAAWIATYVSYRELRLHPNCWLPDGELLLTLFAAMTLTATIVVGILYTRWLPSNIKLNGNCMGNNQLSISSMLPPIPKPDDSNDDGPPDATVKPCELLIKRKPQRSKCTLYI